ncbi:hypothetical protein [Caulobacter sp. UC70_42]
MQTVWAAVRISARIWFWVLPFSEMRTTETVSTAAGLPMSRARMIEASWR